MVCHNNTYLAIAPLSRAKGKRQRWFTLWRRGMNLQNEMSFVPDPVQLQTPLVAGKWTCLRLGSRWRRHQILIGCWLSWGSLVQLWCWLHRSAAVWRNYNMATANTCTTTVSTSATTISTVSLLRRPSSTPTTVW